MNDLQIFRSAEFGSIRTIEQDGKVLFCGRDVAAALGYTNSNKALADHCKSGGVPIRYPIQDSMGRTQQARFIPEGDVYRLITHSRLPAAEQFEHWVFDDVLPAIRRTGSYTVPASHSRQIQHLQSLQKSLKEFRELEEQFAAYATEYRKRYEDNRAHRDTCHAEAAKLERQIDACIASLAIEAVEP